MARIGITLDETQNDRFSALAKFENKKVSTLAAEIILEYMATRKDDVDLILRAKAEYEKNVEALRKGKIHAS